MNRYDALAKICAGLAHPMRIKIYEILKEKGPKMEIVDVVKALRSKYGFNQDYVRARYHMQQMADCGLVKIHRHSKKNDEIELLVSVDISLRDFPEKHEEKRAEQEG